MASAISQVRPGTKAQPVSDPPPPTHGGLGGKLSRLVLGLGLGLGLLVGLYAWLGFRWLPQLLRDQATEFVRVEYGRKLTLGAIQVHPFAFTLDVRDVMLPDEDGAKMLALDRLFVDFEPSASLFRWAYVFDQLTLVGPAVHAVVQKGGELNLAVLAGDAPPDDNDEDDALPRLRIRRLSVHDADAQFSDRDRPKTFSQRIAPLSFILRDFDTRGDDGRLKFSARLPEGAQLSWQGTLRMEEGIHSTGDIAVSHVSIVKLAEYLGSLPCTVSEGWLSLAGSYSLDAGEAVKGEVDLDYLKVEDVGLRRRGGSKDEIRVPAIQAYDVHADVQKSRLSVEQIVIVKPQALATLEPSGHVSLERLASAPAGDAERAAPQPAGEPSDPWEVELGRLTLEKGKVELVDAALAPGTRINVHPINLTAEKLSLDLTRAIAVTLEAGIEGKSAFRARGSVQPLPVSADLEVEIDDVDLSLAQPYLDMFASIRLTSAKVSSQGRVTLGKANAKGEDLVFEGGLRVSEMRAFDTVQRRPLLGFSGLKIDGMRHALGPDSLRIHQIVLQRPYARVVITPEGDLNVAAALESSREQPQGSRGGKPDESASAADAEEEEADDTSDLSLEERILRAGAAMPVTIDMIRVRNMRLDFNDRLVEPDFAADIHGLSGTARGLSTAGRTRARLRLDGRLSTGSPVHIRGTLRPFAFDKFSKIDILFENISLPIFNPYSATFAGYNIERGELRAELHYEVHNRALEANHAIRIDQLAWGEKTATQEKASLPVRLATALIRDRHGVISLDLPVEGTLDDPKFRLGPIIWQVIKNVIVKAVAAPFDLLGKAFKGAEDARYVAFAPGEATLSESQQKSLASLAGALSERESLQVDVPVGTVPALDEEALREQKFDKLVAQAAGGGGDAAGSSLDTLSPEERLEVLTTVYKQLTGERPTLDDTPVDDEGLSRRESREAKAAEQAETLAQQTRDRVPVDPSELSALGERRAEAIERAILKGTELKPSRVLLSTADKVSEDQGKVRFELAVQ